MQLFLKNGYQSACSMMLLKTQLSALSPLLLPQKLDALGGRLGRSVS